MSTVSLEIFKSDIDQLHISFIYTWCGITHRCHLGWHLDFENTPYSFLARGLREEVKFDDEDNLIILANYLSTIKQDENNKIPYGLCFSRKCFSDAGLFLGLKNGEGLTCASFVMSIFDALELPLLKKETWKRRNEDKVWQTNISNKLKITHPERFKEIREHIGQVVRFKPSEVFASGCRVNEGDRPINFENALTIAKEIRLQIKRE